MEILKRNMRKHEMRNKAQLKQFILQEWNRINAETTKSLIDSMNNRFKAVLINKGYPTKY